MSRLINGEQRPQIESFDENKPALVLGPHSNFQWSSDELESHDKDRSFSCPPVGPAEP